MAQSCHISAFWIKGEALGAVESVHFLHALWYTATTRALPPLPRRGDDIAKVIACRLARFHTSTRP